MAGLAVERSVNQPTARGDQVPATGTEELVMVYDLGGGTFDVSILERDAGMLKVRTSRGDTHLGGDDIDRALTANRARSPGRGPQADRSRSAGR